MYENLDNQSNSPIGRHEARATAGDFVWLKRGLIALIALVCATRLALNLVDPDLWGHVRYAQDWLAEGELPRTASHTFTAVDYPWINHENLAELALALGYEHLGPLGLLAAKCAWGMAILLAMVWVARRHGVHPLVVWPLIFLLATNLEPFFPLRPQLLSFGLCALTLVLLDRGFESWQAEGKIAWKFLMPLPLVFAVWVNSHGAFVAGLCIVGMLLAGRIVEAILRSGRDAWPAVWRLVLLGSWCVVATMANPYGLEMHRWLVNSLGRPRPEISEWLPPNPNDPTFWPWVALLGVIIVSLCGTRLRRDLPQIAALMLVGWQSAEHLRHIAFLALLAGFWIPPHLQSALSRLREGETTKLPAALLPRPLAWSFGVLLAAAIATQSVALVGRLSELPVDRNRFPVDALDFMVKNNLHGRLVVSFDWAQYAIAALAPETEVAFDGRFRTCYPQEVVDMHFDFLLGEDDVLRNRSPSSGPVDATRVLDYGRPDLVLVERRYKNAVEVMKDASRGPDAEWVLLYCDRVAELWGRRARYNRRLSSDFFPRSARCFDAGERTGTVPWPALPTADSQSRWAGTSTSEPETQLTVN